MTRRSKAIKEGGDCIGYVVKMSQALAARYGIKQGDFIKAWSRYGYIVIKADVTDIVCGGVIRILPLQREPLRRANRQRPGYRQEPDL